MFKPFVTLLACFLSVVPLISHAGNAVGTTISRVEIITGPTGLQNTDLAFVYVSTSINSPMNCAPDTNNGRFVINLATPSGRAAYVLIMNAKANGATVNLYGKGNCNLFNGTENLISYKDNY